MQLFSKLWQRSSTWIESQQVSILSAASIIMLANVASALAGLVKNRVLSGTFITSQYGTALEAYWVAFRLPDMVYQLLVLGLLSAALVPILAGHMNKNKEEAYVLVNQALLIVLTIFGVLAAVVFVFVEPLIGLVTGHQFSDELFALAVQLSRIMLGAQVLFALSGFASALLQTQRRFIVPAFTPVFYNLGIIIVTVLGHSRLGLAAAAWGTVVGAALHLLVQLPLLIKLGWRPIWGKWQGTELFRMLQLSLPRTLALLLNQLHLIVITFLATSLGGLSLTIMTFAQQLMTVPIRFFGASIGQASLPFLAAKTDDLTVMRRLVFRSLRQIVFFTAPLAALLLVLRVPVIRLAYGTDEFPWRATLTTAMVLGVLAVSSIPQAAIHLFLRAFYAVHDTRTPFVISVISLVLTTVLGWGAVYWWSTGTLGLAIALAVGASVEAVLLFILLLRRLPGNSLDQLMWSLGRLTLAAVLMSVTLFVFQRVFDLYVFETSKTIELMLLAASVSLLGGGVYLLFCWILKVEELTILERLLQRGRREISKLTGQSIQEPLAEGFSSP